MMNNEDQIKHAKYTHQKHAKVTTEKHSDQTDFFSVTLGYTNLAYSFILNISSKCRNLYHSFNH